MVSEAVGVAEVTQGGGRGKRKSAEDLWALKGADESKGKGD